MLSPGDCLHIPSGWWVREECPEHSIGLAVVSADRRRELAEGELWGLPLPLLEPGWPPFDAHTVLAE